MKVPAREAAGRLFTLGWIGVALLAVAAVPAFFLLGSYRVFEPPFYAATILMILHSHAVRDCLKASRPWRVAVLAVFVAAMLVTQMGRFNRQYYPFVTWMMYSLPPKEEVKRRRLVAIDSQGNEQEISMYMLVPPHMRSLMYHRLRRLDSDPELLGETVRVMLRRHPDAAQFRRVEWRPWSVIATQRPLVITWDEEAAIDIPLDE
jgi:hypothetical protein